MYKWIFAASQVLETAGLDFSRLVGSNHYVTHRANDVMGYLMPMETAEALFVLPALLQPLSGESDTAQLPSPFVLTDAAKQNWRTYLDNMLRKYPRLADSDDFRAAEEQYARAIAEPDATPAPVEEAVVVGDRWAYDSGAFRPAREGEEGYVFPQTVLDDRGMIEAAITSFLHNRDTDIPGFLFTHNGRTYTMSGWLPPREAIPEGAFAIVIPEPYEECQLQPTYAIAGLRAFSFSEVSTNGVFAAQEEARTARGVTFGYVFRDLVDGIILPLGNQPEWTNAESQAFLAALPEFASAHKRVFPTWLVGEPTTQIVSYYAEATEKQLRDCEEQIARKSAEVEQYRTRLRASERDLNTSIAEKTAVEAGRSAENWAQTQLEVLRGLGGVIEHVEVAEEGRMFAIITKPITYVLGKYEYLFGSYRIEVGSLRSTLPNNVPIAIQNLTRGPGTYQHPHCNSDGRYCWGNTDQIFSSCWNHGDIIGTVGAILSYLQHVNMLDSYSTHLAYFDRRTIGSSKKAWCTPKPQWSISTDLEAARSAARRAEGEARG